jgi:class 3 adenylate cyclase
MTAFEQILPGAAALGRPLSRNIRTLRAFRTAVALSSAQDQIISTVSPAVMLNIWYERGTITAVDEPLGRFYSNGCPTNVVRDNLADRACQCAKGPRRFYAHSLLDWMNATSKALSNSSYMYQMTTCSVLYTALARPSEYERTIVLSSVLGGAGLIALFVFILLFTRQPTRDNSYAVTDNSKPFTIVFTDIMASTVLWGRAPELMGPAVDAHHEMIRRILKKHKGYEVKTIGDSFMAVFRSPTAACRFGVEVQRCFFDRQWGTTVFDEVYRELEQRTEGSSVYGVPQEGATAPPPANSQPTEGVVVGNNAEVGASKNPLQSTSTRPTAASTDETASPPRRISRTAEGGKSIVPPSAPSEKQNCCWNGLRVRVAIHYGQGDIKHDQVTLGYDYYGTVVNTAARVEALAHGGQIVITSDAKLAMESELLQKGGSDASGFLEDFTLKALGSFPLRGLDHPVFLFQVDPIGALSARVFPPLRVDSEALMNEFDVDTEGEGGSQHSEQSSMELTPDVIAHRLARRMTGGDPTAYATVYSSLHLCFSFIKHLYQPSSDRARQATVDNLAKGWRVSSYRKFGKLSARDRWDLQLMLIIAKVYPGFERKEAALEMKPRSLFGEAADTSSLFDA